MDYKEAGVDIQAGEIFVDRIKKIVGNFQNERVIQSIGGFASLYKMDADRYISASTDGVGTKLLLCIETDKYDSIGYDLVGMCINDLLCTGSRPLFFLDYYACGKLDLSRSEKLVQGIANACEESSCILIGGETAEMPDLYSHKHFDLAGFSVGEVYTDQLLGGDRVKAGMNLISIASSGFHSNGFSLIRKFIKKEERELMLDCLTPTKLYSAPLLKLAKEKPQWIAGLSHITGGGIENISRMNPKLRYDILTPPPLSELPQFVQVLLERMPISEKEMYRTFNMGMGMVIATAYPKELFSALVDLGLRPQHIGEVR